VTRSLIFAALAALVVAGPAAAETYQFVSQDGTVHFTNAPSDPRYRRMVQSVPAVSGTAEGWLRVPTATPAASLTEIIRLTAERHNVPHELVSAVIRVESGFNVRAVSPKGARGLMQLMPQTANILGVRDSFDPSDNIDGGVRHLRGLLDTYGNDLPLVLAAYNAGEGAVKRHGGIPPYAETQAYVERIMSILGAGQAVASMPASTFQYTADDGAVVYTNIPPRGVARKKR
jgi:soluble lytic murein transglycosylase-like protein